MSRYAKDRTRDSGLRPVQRVELDENHAGRKLLIAAALLAVGTLFIAYAITQCNAAAEGWTTVDASSSVDIDNAGEFTLLYELGAGETDATAERKALTVAYANALEHAAQLFSSLNEYEGVVNLQYIGAHPNEVLTVDDELYAALELLERYGNRDIFLAPILDTYQSLFLVSDDSEVGYFDPETNADVRAYFDEVLAFVQDPEQVGIELLGENRVRFTVSAEYLDFCAEQGISHLLDLGWMKNAFIVDAVADALEAEGFTHGSLSSFDGFARNMDTRADTAYAVDVYDREGNVVHMACVMTYPAEVRALVAWRTYGLGSEYDRLRWYETDAGVLYHTYLDGEDGLCRAALADLVTYSDTLGCAEMALAVAPIFIADELDDEALDVLSVEHAWSVYCRDKAIVSNGIAALNDIAAGYRTAA